MQILLQEYLQLKRYVESHFVAFQIIYNLDIIVSVIVYTTFTNFSM